MKTLPICILLLTTIAPQAWASPGLIVTDGQPGQIYFVGVCPDSFGILALYYSPDDGENIQLRDLVYNPWDYRYGYLLSDPTDSCFYRLWSTDYTFDLTTNAGLTWQVMNDTLTGNEYASGITSGEVYRNAPYPIDFQIQRSTNFGQAYTPCSTLGFPDSSGGIEEIALGTDSGEVYAYTGDHSLFYSSDFGEHFSFLGNLYQYWGIVADQIHNGAQNGEVYIYLGDSSPIKHIWRVYDYATQIQVVGEFLLGFDWICSPATAEAPGELYFLALQPSMVSGGTMRIYHTTNYGQQWTYFEHELAPGGAVKEESAAQELSISLQIFPNPANPSFSVHYQLLKLQLVQIELFNLMGQRVWYSDSDFQLPGNHQMDFTLEDISSGNYILRLQTTKGQICHPLTIMK